MPSKENAEVEIIRLLKKGPGGYVSGQALSASLDISRTAVWKHIKILRKSGFSIEASPSKGYMLKDPSRAPFNRIGVLSGLSTEFIGKRLFFYETLDSTNVKAYELGRNGEPEGTAVIAESQTGGKGRIGRRWESPPGVNLYTSIILRPGIPPQYAHNLTFLAAVALAQTISSFVPKRPAVKWPNDILMDSRKTAGILMEMDSEADRVNFVIAGIGVNLNMREDMFPEHIRATATSLFEKRGTEVERAEFSRSLYSSVEKWYKVYLNKGFKPVLEAWRGYFDSEGKPVKVNCLNKTVEGICMGVDGDGALLVMTPSGVCERVISGDMERIREEIPG